MKKRTAKIRCSHCGDSHDVKDCKLKAHSDRMLKQEADRKAAPKNPTGPRETWSLFD